MKLLVFCVKDRATDMFGTPMFMVTSGQAVRSFTDEINRPDKDNQLFNHSTDFDLYSLGGWDSSSAEFVLEKFPALVVRGQDVRIKG